MVKKIRVFISYQRSTGSELRAAIAHGLQKLDNVEVIVDKDVIEYSDVIHKRISQKLDDCDCILVSSKSFDSQEVISELIRADERGKKIYVLQKENEEKEIPSHLYFLNDQHKIFYSDVDNLEKQLAEFFKAKNKEDFEVISSYLRPIQEEVELQKLLKFKAELSKKILREAHKEIKQLKSQKYNINVGIEKNFLVRARSIFEEANEVYAVSIDTVSTFWTDVKNRSLAEEYIRSQPNNTVRLFVFSSPRIANRYRHILQANHNSYGEAGRVFICSLHSYKNFLEQFGSVLETETYLTKDFGLLVYMHKNLYSESEEKYYIEAFLDHSELNFKTVDIFQASKINYQNLLNYFQELRDLNFENTSEKKVLGKKKVFIKRWNPKCVNDDTLWQDDLSKLFPEERYGDVYHFVFFKGCNNNLENKIREAKNALSNARKSMQIKSIWFGKKTDRFPIADFQYGQLKLGFDYEYVLIMNFANNENLRSYYADRRHSDIRKRLYKNLHGSLELLYEYLDEIRETDQEKGFEIFEKTIEEIVSNYMVRYDFVDKEDIDSIARELPYEFPYDYDI